MLESVLIDAGGKHGDSRRERGGRDEKTEHRGCAPFFIERIVDYQRKVNYQTSPVSELLILKLSPALPERIMEDGTMFVICTSG